MSQEAEDHTRNNHDSDHRDWLKKAERPGISAKPLDKRVRERLTRDCATHPPVLCRVVLKTPFSVHTHVAAVLDTPPPPSGK